MPELPEVECLTRAVEELLVGRTISEAIFHRQDLRWPIPTKDFHRLLVGSPVLKVYRRSKYMLVETERGCGIFHLGMSGNMLLSETREPSWKHTHASFRVAAGQGSVSKDLFLHFVDPRRFGCILACSQRDLAGHPLLFKLGPEPLDKSDLAEHLWQRSRGKSVVVKSFLMDAQHVVGVGNIYANESLFRAGVRPTRQSTKVKRSEWEKIAEAIQSVLKAAIRAGGTSFRDYRHADGKAGSFELSLQVYGREGEFCVSCASPIKHKKISGRATYFCPECQI